MWLLKLTGAVLLTCSGIAASHVMNRKESEALRQNEGMMALLRTVRGQIECFARPIPEILSACERKELDACGYFGEDVPKDLLGVIGQCRRYDEESVEIVSRFAEEFGRGYREDEVRACDYTLSLLDQRREVLAKELPAKKKRNTVLSVCAALALALLLL